MLVPGVDGMIFKIEPQDEDEAALYGKWGHTELMKLFNSVETKAFVRIFWREKVPQKKER